MNVETCVNNRHTEVTPQFHNNAKVALSVFEAEEKKKKHNVMEIMCTFDSQHDKWKMLSEKKERKKRLCDYNGRYMKFIR